MRPITMSDLCELTGYSRHQLRSLLDELPRFSNRHAAARVARVFSNHDVMLLAVLCRLESGYGLRRDVVAALCEPIAASLLAPRQVSSKACLVIDLCRMSCNRADSVPLIDDGLIVALEPIFLNIDSYLLPEPLVQREMGLSAAVNVGKLSAAESAAARVQEKRPRNRQRGKSNHG